MVNFTERILALASAGLNFAKASKAKRCFFASSSWDSLATIEGSVMLCSWLPREPGRPFMTIFFFITFLALEVWPASVCSAAVSDPWASLSGDSGSEDD